VLVERPNLLFDISRLLHRQRQTRQAERPA
jgi:hypothetical protein